MNSLYTCPTQLAVQSCSDHSDAPTHTCYNLFAAEGISCLSSHSFPIVTAAHYQLLLSNLQHGHQLLGPPPSPHPMHPILSSHINLQFAGVRLQLPQPLLLLTPLLTYLSTPPKLVWCHLWKHACPNLVFLLTLSPLLVITITAAPIIFSIGVPILFISPLLCCYKGN